MKKTISLLYTAIILFSLCSCEKVIDLSLNTSPSQIVIQGNVYDQPGPDTIKISTSVKFDQSNIYPAVTGATVTINSNMGESEVLTEITSGVYITSKLQGVPGRTYTLTVETNGKTYTASSTMPTAVNIDSIYLQNSSFGNNKEVTINFLDPVNINNYYRIVEFINNIRQNSFYVTDDNLSEGEVIKYSIRGSNGEDIKLKTGDTINIWLETIDKDAYEYFRSAEVDDSSTPANPVSNIDNSALGYFNACSVRKIMMVVP